MEPGMSEAERAFVITFTKRHEDMILEVTHDIKRLTVDVGSLCTETQNNLNDFGLEISEEIDKLQKSNQEITASVKAMMQHIFAQDREIARLRALLAKGEPDTEIIVIDEEEEKPPAKRAKPSEES